MLLSFSTFVKMSICRRKLAWIAYEKLLNRDKKETHFVVFNHIFLREIHALYWHFSMIFHRRVVQSPKVGTKKRASSTRLSRPSLRRAAADCCCCVCVWRYVLQWGPHWDQREDERDIFLIFFPSAMFCSCWLAPAPKISLKFSSYRFFSAWIQMNRNDLLIPFSCSLRISPSSLFCYALAVLCRIALFIFFSFSLFFRVRAKKLELK